MHLCVSEYLFFILIFFIVPLPKLQQHDYLYMNLYVSLEKDIEVTKSGGRRYFLKRNANPELVIAACTRKLGIDPTETRALYIRATSYFKIGKYKQAEDDLSRLLITKIDDVEALFLRGRVREKVQFLLYINI